jgi:hypothetical protein
MRPKFIMQSLLLGVLLVLSISDADAFRRSSTQSFTDPDFIGYQPKRLLLVVMDASPAFRAVIEEQVKKTLEKSGLVVVLERTLFPPTRQWDPDKRREILSRESIDTGLLIGLGSADRSVIPMGTQTFGSGSATISGGGIYGSGQASTINIQGVRSSAIFGAALMTFEGEKIAWYADVSTSAEGLLFVGDKSDAKTVASEILKALQKDGHIVKTKKGD